jgi:methylated-DNA-[protein]-cysteine S-methyltransferase
MKKAIRKKAINVQATSFCFIETPEGKVVVAEDGVGISALFFVRGGAGREQDVQYINEKGLDILTLNEQETPLLKQAASQLKEYFDGKRKNFDLPLSFNGTPFQIADWRALLSIPYGETRSYKQIAEQIGSPKACRAVGLANNRNPISIIIPCHRVIGSDSSLVGYGGGLDIKERLLALEKEHTKQAGS